MKCRRSAALVLASALRPGQRRATEGGGSAALVRRDIPPEQQPSLLPPRCRDASVPPGVPRLRVLCPKTAIVVDDHAVDCTSSPPNESDKNKTKLNAAIMKLDAGEPETDDRQGLHHVMSALGRQRKRERAANPPPGGVVFERLLAQSASYFEGAAFTARRSSGRGGAASTAYQLQAEAAPTP